MCPELRCCAFLSIDCPVIAKTNCGPRGIVQRLCVAVGLFDYIPIGIFKSRLVIAAHVEPYIAKQGQNAKHLRTFLFFFAPEKHQK